MFNTAYGTILFGADLEEIWTWSQILFVSSFQKRTKSRGESMEGVEKTVKKEKSHKKSKKKPKEGITLNSILISRQIPILIAIIGKHWFTEFTLVNP